MNVSQEMRDAIGALMARYKCGTVSPEFMMAFRQTFDALADQVEELENTVVPVSARGIPPEDLPPNVVAIRRAPHRAPFHTIEGGRP